MFLFPASFGSATAYRARPADGDKVDGRGALGGTDVLTRRGCRPREIGTDHGTSPCWPAIGVESFSLLRASSFGPRAAMEIVPGICRHSPFVCGPGMRGRSQFGLLGPRLTGRHGNEASARNYAVRLSGSAPGTASFRTVRMECQGTCALPLASAHAWALARCRLSHRRNSRGQ